MYEQQSNADCFDIETPVLEPEPQDENLNSRIPTRSSQKLPSGNKSARSP